MVAQHFRKKALSPVTYSATEKTRMLKIGGVANASRLLHGRESVRPQLMFLDWDVCRYTASDLVAALRLLCPNLFAVALGSLRQEKSLALAVGLDEFLCKSDPPQKLFEVACLRSD